MTGPACLQCGLAAAQALSSISTEINLGCRNADGALECQFNLKRRKAIIIGAIQGLAIVGIWWMFRHERKRQAKAWEDSTWQC